MLHKKIFLFFIIPVCSLLSRTNFSELSPYERSLVNQYLLNKGYQEIMPYHEHLARSILDIQKRLPLSDSMKNRHIHFLFHKKPNVIFFSKKEIIPLPNGNMYEAPMIILATDQLNEYTVDFLTFVIAHEIGHLSYDHFSNNKIYSKAAQIICSRKSNKEKETALALILEMGIIQELQADMFGIRYSDIKNPAIAYNDKIRINNKLCKALEPYFEVNDKKNFLQGVRTYIAHHFDEIFKNVKTFWRVNSLEQYLKEKAYPTDELSYFFLKNSLQNKHQTIPLSHDYYEQVETQLDQILTS